MDKETIDRLNEIVKRIDDIEDSLAWVITAEQRGFEVGDRVTFSPRAVRRRIAIGKRADKIGTITAIHHAFGVKVRFDGNKSTRGFHHSFLEKVK